VLPIIRLIEKGSKWRHNTPNKRLRQALHAYITEERTPEGPLLFQNKHKPFAKTKYIASDVLERICLRAKLQRINPHAFRRYVVNTAMKAGNKLETVQKWIGHSNASVTMKHYWTDDLAELDIMAPILHATGDKIAAVSDGSDNTMARQLIEAVEEIRRLKALVAELQSGVKPVSEHKEPMDETAAVPYSRPVVGAGRHDGPLTFFFYQIL